MIYLAFVFLLCIPIVMAELSLGRRGHGSPVASMMKLGAEAGAGRHWHSIGWLSIIIPLLGLSYYCIVAGWSLDYIVKAAANAFAGYDGERSQQNFDQLLASPWRLLLVHSLFIIVTVMVVGSGLQSGIERITKIMVPCLFIVLIILVINSIYSADIKAGLTFLFSPDWSKLTPTVIIMALGQALFSVAIGVGVLMTYGAYMPKSFSLTTSATIIVLADTLVAILAGIAIFPLVFQYGLDPSSGPGLIFVSLPVAFGQMPAGHLFGLLFFVLLFFAAFSTAIGMLEPAVSWFQGPGRSRFWMAVCCAGTAWFVGLAALLSFNLWSDFRPLPWIPLFKDKGIFDLFDFTVSNILLPVNALLISLFAGWVMSRQSVADELQMNDERLFRCWRFSIRYVAPIAILCIFISSF